MRIEVMFPYWIGFVLSYIIYHGVVALTSGGWSRSKSAYLKKPSLISGIGRLNIDTQSLALLLARALLFLLVLFVLFVQMKYATIAGVSNAATITIYALNAFPMAVAFQVIYKEKLKIVHWIGMALIAVCVILIGIQAELRRKSATLETHNYSLAWVPILCALIIVGIIVALGLLM